MQNPARLPPVVAATGHRTFLRSLIIGSGEMAERIRNHPWCDSPLGPIETWPATLLSHVNLILNSPAALAIYWGPEMIFLGNDASFRSLGPRSTEALGISASELWGPNWHQVRDRFEAVLASGEAFHGESIPFIFPRQGKADDCFIDYTLSPIYHDGHIAGVFRSLHETTGTVLAMRALAESNERLRMALSAGNGYGVWDMHIQSGIVYADETIASLYGIDPAAAAAGVSHLLFQRMLHPDDISALSDAIMGTILTGKEYSVEYRIRRHTPDDGSFHWVRSMGRCVYDAEGHACRVTGLKTAIADPDSTTQTTSQIAQPASPAMHLVSGGQWDSVPASIRDFLATAIYSLAEFPEELTLEAIPGPDATKLVIHACAEDLGQIIGKQGRTMRSVRTLLLAINRSNKHSFSVDVLDRKKPLAP